MKSIEERVRAEIAIMLAVPESKATDEATFEELGADSLDKVELALHLEDRFSIEIPDEETERIATVREAINLVVAKVSAK